MLVKTFGVVGFSALAMLQTPKPTADVIENAEWTRAPASEAVAQYSPQFANMIGVPGRVRLRCMAVFEGTPQDCQIVWVSPEGLGFEDAARLVAATGVIRPRRINGTFVPAPFTFVVNFLGEPIPSQPDPEYKGSKPSARAIELARQAVEQFPEWTAQDPWADMIGSLAPDRQSVVAGWLEELFPDDAKEEIERTSLAIARTVPLAQLERFATDRTPPDEPSQEAWEEAMGGWDLASIVALKTLRTRYCARWSCTDVSE